MGNPPHAVLVPFPAQGHVNPMLQLAKLLHHKGFHITFVNTDFNHDRLLRSRGPDSLTGLPSFNFVSIPDGLPPSDPDSTQDVGALFRCIAENTFRAPFMDLLCKLNSANPPVSCIVSDTIMIFSVDAARELGIPVALLYTSSVCGLLAYSHYPHLIQKGLVPLKDVECLTNGYLDTVIDWIPGMEGITLKYIPTFIRTTDPDDFIVHFCIDLLQRCRDASAMILHSFEELEDDDVLNALSPMFPPLYAIGPLHKLVDSVTDKSLSFLGSNLWKEDAECLQWLHSKQPNSVIYVNFGSITVMTRQQLVEFAWGLANSNKNFLWIIRPDLVSGEDAIIPPEFGAETKERGLLASWCPQEQVLNHPSIGGFLTHSGWNSTQESISAGVPMLCWPFFSEQQTNCWYCCNKWGVGMEIDGDVSRDKVEKLVVELMDSEKGAKMKRKAMELKSMAEEAVGPNGTSQFNLDKLIKEVLCDDK